MGILKRWAGGILGGILFVSAVFTGIPIQALAAPEIVAGNYEIDMERIPKVHFAKHKNWETLYETAWESHKSNIRAVSKGLNPELTTDEKQSYYVDEAFDDRIFQWDTLFMMLFDKYGLHEFPTLNSMDNFYYHQYDTEDESDGYISRMIYESDGRDYYNDYMNVDAINPPMFAWAEWEQYKIHGDIGRFLKKVKGKAIIDRLDSYYQFIKRTRRHKTGPAAGLYVSNGQGSGLDNTPDQDYQGWGQAVKDMSFQQVQAASYLQMIAAEILDKKEGLTEEERRNYEELKEKYAQEEQELTALIQEKLWSEEKGCFFNMDSRTGELKDVVTPMAFWSFAAGAATKDQMDRMIEGYALNSNKMYRPNGLSTVCYDHPAFKSTGGYWNGAMWSPASFQWLKGLQKCGYDDLAFEEAVRHVNGLADVCSKGAYDRYGEFLHTLWENYSTEYAIPGSTEFSDTQPARANFVGWAGALGIGSVIEDLAGITISGNENAIDWNIKLTEAFGIDNLYYNGPDGENFVSLACEERVSATSGAKLTVKADHAFELRVKVGERSETIQAEAGEHQYIVEGTDGTKSYLGMKTSKLPAASFSADKLTEAGSTVCFGAQGNSTKDDGLSGQVEIGAGRIFNVNTVGFYRTNEKYPAELRSSGVMRELGTKDAMEYVKTASPFGEEGFMFMTPASNSMQTAKVLLGVKNGTAVVEADLMDASEVTKTVTLQGGSEETVYAVEIPNCAAGDTSMMVTAVLKQNSGDQGEISIKAVLLEDGGTEALGAPEQVTAESENAALTVNASMPEGVSYDSYRVYYKKAEDNGWQVKEASSMPYLLQDLENYKRYDVFVTGVKNGKESSDSQIVSQIPEKTAQTDAKRAYSDWLEVQEAVLNGNEDFSKVAHSLNFQVSGTTYGTEFSFSSGSHAGKFGLKNNGAVINPVLPQKNLETELKVSAACGEKTITITVPVTVLAVAEEDAYYVSGEKGNLTFGTVNLTEEGETDWIQFGAENPENCARKENSTEQLKNFKTLGSMDRVISDAAFAFTASDGTRQPSDHTAVSTKGPGSGFSIELPFCDKPQTAKFYANAWGGDVTFELLVNGTSVYADTFGKDDSDGMAGQEFSVTYKMPSNKDTVEAKLYCSRDLGKWGGCVTALQAVTVKEADGDVFDSEDLDAQVKIMQYAQPQNVSLTKEGSADWKLFTSTDLTQIEKKAGGRGISNLSAIQAVSKLNGDPSDALFSYTDGTNSKEGSYNKGIVFEKAGNGIQFTLPYRPAGQQADIYLGAWSSKVKIHAAAVKGNQIIEEYVRYFDTGEQASEAPAIYQVVSLDYRLEDPESVLQVEISNETLYDETWGNFNLGAITLGSSFFAEASANENGTLIITNPSASAGEEVTVFAVPKEGFYLKPESLKYCRKDDGSEVLIEGESFLMPAGDVVVTAEFIKEEPPLVTSVIVKAERTVLSVGEQTKAEALVLPENAGNKAVSWSSSDEAVIKVSADGVVTAAAEGNARVIAAASDQSGVTGSAEITVVKASGTQKPDGGKEAVLGNIYESGGYCYKVTNLTGKTAEVVAGKDKKRKKIVVPDTVLICGKKFKVTAVGAKAFQNYKRAHSAVIGKYVVKIGKQAFSGCTKLKKADIKSTKLTEIGSKAFYRCKALKNVIIKSKKVKKAGKYAFRGIHKNAALKAPSAKKKFYKKLFAWK